MVIKLTKSQPEEQKAQGVNSQTKAVPVECAAQLTSRNASGSVSLWKWSTEPGGWPGGWCVQLGVMVCVELDPRPRKHGTGSSFHDVTRRDRLLCMSLV